MPDVMVSKCFDVIKFSFSIGSLVQPDPKYCVTVLLISSNPSCWAIPVVVATSVLPALFHCQVEVWVWPSKYSSITIRPFTRIINDFVFFSIRYSFKSSAASSFQPKLEKDFVSQAPFVLLGK